MDKKTINRGFTLIELIVVIAIIAILASVAAVSLNSALKKGRDARRKADIKQIEKALEVNYSMRGAYTQPENMCSDTSYGGLGGCGDSGGTGEWDANSDLRDLIADGIMGTLPKDPVNNSTYKYTYEVWNAGEGGYAKAGQAYDLCATLEAGGSFCINKRN